MTEDRSGHPRATKVETASLLTPTELCARLVEVIVAQLVALEAGDFARFGALSDERDALVEALGRGDGASLGTDARVLLERARVLAARASETAARLRQETAAELGALRRGATALHGYARPGAELARQYSRYDHAR